MMVVDSNGFLEKLPNVKYVTEVDLGLYEKMLVWTAGGPYYLPWNKNLGRLNQFQRTSLWLAKDNWRQKANGTMDFKVIN